MTLTQEGRGVIRLGDATTHGGKVVSAAHTTATVMGIPIACVGNLTQCPKCKGSSWKAMPQTPSMACLQHITATKPPAARR